MTPTIRIITIDKGGHAAAHVFSNLTATRLDEGIAEALVLLNDITPVDGLGVISLTAKSWPAGSEYLP